MKINKSILTGMTALSLFATSAAAATSAVTPIVSNASTKKAKKAVKHTYTINSLTIAKSKGHATHYYKNTMKFRETKAVMTKKGITGTIIPGTYYGYSLNHRTVLFKLRGNRIVRISKSCIVYTQKKHKPIKDTMFVSDGSVRISKAEFNKLNKAQMR